MADPGVPDAVAGEIPCRYNMMDRLGGPMRACPSTHANKKM